ncbi:MAG: hypothetical protein LCH73_13330 [Proteobacteria bacterium]|nr:hypothetical protein [Pseudomonadota bacterium]
MTETLLLSIATTGFLVAFAHAAIPTHWLPFVLAARGQRWSKGKALAIVALCGAGHVLFTAVLGALLVWLGIETSKWAGGMFTWIAGGALVLFGLYYLIRQLRGGGHGHHHFDDHGGHDDHHRTGKHDHDSHDHHDHERHPHGDPGHAHAAGSADAKGASSRTPDASNAVLAAPDQGRGAVASVGSDRAVIASLFTLLTFSPCEGFLPVYVSGIRYGWLGFVLLSAVLAVATVAGMLVFTGLTLSGIERLQLDFLERYESGILGALILLLGVGIMFFGF